MKPRRKPQHKKRSNPARRKRGNTPPLLPLYGVHTVLAACANPRRKLHKLYVTRNILKSCERQLEQARCPVEILENREISTLAPEGAVHQGILAMAAPLPATDISELKDCALVLVLDQITDPHNVGAILRSAAAFNAGAVIITARNSPEAAGVLAKTASGGLEHVPLVEAVNLARALEILARQRFTIVGFDSEAEFALEKAPITAPAALVLGAEGKGLRRLTREKCDLLVRLDMPGPIKSLNVSNAAALALYACSAVLK
ncbi:MAG TPA: 23S rRNA (guanosine(2251)-2'-O)-methyltransferase RlmB [Rhizobiales bacterium]|nr:23S rRNA (guanosine(2251)-2'-O)-methyltransferase RlmB [Hyphomicrobiales bacterium]